MPLLSCILGQSLQRHMVKNSCCIQPIDNLWYDFVASQDFVHVKNHLAASAIIGGEEDGASLDLWIDVLAEACNIWKILVHDDDDSVSLNDYKPYIFHQDEDDGELKMQMEMWETICILMKGVFYLANNLPLHQLAIESPQEFLLHAATSSLALCATRSGSNCEVLRLIFEKILSLHQDQLSVVGPVSKRVPLHIAAANKCFAANQAIAKSKDAPSESAHFNTEILQTILQLGSASTASICDADGNYPMHLACSSGYSWTGGLGNVFFAAPEVIKARNLPSLFVLVAESNANQGHNNKMRRKATMTPKWMRSSRTWLRNQKTKTKQIRKNDGRVQEINTIFQLIQSVPELVL